MRNKYNAKKKESIRLRFHTQTAGVSLTAQEPENNIVRVTLQGLAAVLGGTQSLHTNSFDEALCLPTEKAAKIALRTQQIIAYESGVADTVDPLAGSYYIEWLTDKMEQQAEEYFSRIEELGGVIPAIHKNFFQTEIANAAYKYQREIDSNKRFIIGVNKFQSEKFELPELLAIEEAVSEHQINRLNEIKKNRDNEKVNILLTKLKEAAKGTENLIPYILDAVKEYTSIGEIIEALKEVFGVYREKQII